MADQYRLPPPLFPPRTPQAPQEMPQWAKAIQDSIRNLYQTLSNRLEGLVTVGLIADRPPANGTFRFYLALDTKTLYFDDGVWSSFEGVPDIVQPDWSNVKNFGATGDGATNDAPAIQDTLGQTGAVFFPPGIYLIGTPLVIPSNTTLIGYQAVIKLANGVNNHVVKTALGGSHIAIDNLEIDGNGANNTGSAGLHSGIFIDSTVIDVCTHVIVRNCYVHDTYLEGIQAGEAATDCFIIGNRVRNSFTTSGINISRGGGNCKRFLVAGNIVDNCPATGIGATAAIQQCVFANNIVRITGTSPTVPGDNMTGYHENNEDVAIVGNSCFDGSNHNIHFSGTNISVVGNVCSNTSGAGVIIGSSHVPAPAAANCVIAGNAINNAVRGIWTRNVINCSITGNTIGNSADRGILAQWEQTPNAHNHLLISGNVVHHGGVDAAIQTNGEIEEGVISNNLLVGVGSPPVGLQLHIGAVGFTVSGNRITGFDIAINETSPSTGSLIVGNNLRTNTQGIVLSNTSSTTMCFNNRASPTAGVYTVVVVGANQTVTIPADSPPFVKIGASAAASVNDFIPKWAGRTLYLQFADANVTLNTASADLFLSGGTDKTGNAADIIQLVCDGTAWLQAATVQANA